MMLKEKSARQTGSDIQDNGILYMKEIYDEQEKRIQNVITDIEDDDMELYKVWSNYLVEKLKFPFEAEVNKYQEPSCFIKQGDKLKVIKIV